MNRYPPVSVIIPTKNEEQNIVRCLKSIKKQAYQGKIEIIVVDNFSEDKTVKLAKKFTKKVFLQGPERSNQRNFGTQKSKGKYLLFVDADMELKRNTVSECIRIYQASPTPPTVAIKEFSVGTTFLGKAQALERNCYQDATFLQGARFFPKTQFLKIGGFDTKLIAAEDWDITLRFVKAGFPVRTTSTPLITHHESKESLLKLLKKEIYYIKNIKFYRKKHPEVFFYQSNIFFRLLIWLKSWRSLIRHPILTLAFLWYKFSVWILWLIYTI